MATFSTDQCAAVIDRFCAFICVEHSAKLENNFCRGKTGSVLVNAIGEFFGIPYNHIHVEVVCPKA